jgi:hypothetical protein
MYIANLCLQHIGNNFRNVAIKWLPKYFKYIYQSIDYIGRGREAYNLQSALKRLE